ncbi:MAG: hypothetical protein JNL28_11710 [Planctomycetes bacterium]|nr:hypothetical protein [Planctomycetota bacterium]
MRQNLFVTALTTLALALPASAQNCSQTAVGLVPLNDLGTGMHGGFQGGLYPLGSNTRPEAHTVDGLAAAQQVVPRNAAGDPSADGKIVLLSIGMSNTTQEFQALQALATADPLRHPRVQLVDGAQGGQTAATISNPAANFWTVVDQRLANSSASANQVQVVWFKEADANPNQAFPVHAQILQSEFTAIMAILKSRFPNLRQCFLASRIYAGYATGTLNPEPYAYEQGFAVKWTIESQIQGTALNFDPARGPVVAPWIDWGTYNWADGLTARSDGLTWLCSDYQPDGTHPSPAGRTKVANLLLAFLHTEPTAASWYLARPEPFAYGVGKTTSIASVPAIGWSGSPTLLTNDFSISVSNGVPNAPGILFLGTQPARTPFLAAHLYVGGALVRLPVHVLDGAGASSWPVPVSAGLIGRTYCYQGYLRDSGQSDGSGAVLSNALRVVFSP